MRVGESWEIGGVDTCTYSQHKAEGEQRLAQELARRGDVDRVAVLRPCMVAQRIAGAIMMRSGAPAWLPGNAIRHLPLSPVDRDLPLQIVHSDDVAHAVGTVLDRDAHGAFNLAADGLMTGPGIADALDTRISPLPMPQARHAAALAWHSRVFPWIPAGSTWPCSAPSSTRARRNASWGGRSTRRSTCWRRSLQAWPTAPTATRRCSDAGRSSTGCSPMCGEARCLVGARMIVLAHHVQAWCAAVNLGHRASRAGVGCGSSCTSGAPARPDDVSRAGVGRRPTLGHSALVGLLVVRPHPEHMDDAFVRQHLVDESVLDVDPA